jgi:hypothetical protein
MNWKWRALAGALLLAGTIVWLPRAVSTSAETRYHASSTTVHSPASDNGDNDEGDNGSSDNNNNNDNSSGNANSNDNSSGNNNNNDNTSGNNNNNDNSSDLVNTQSTPVPPNTSPPSNSGQNGSLTVKLDVSNNFKPVVNAPFQITVTGSGAPIDQVSWWADGGGPNAGPNNDDLAHMGTSTSACNGANPCSQTWTVQARNTGYYTIHAQTRDTSGNVAQIDTQVLVSENARN